ncbi:MAG: hypothetical protein RIQ60_561 [Pseudomonadota bacterium]|jgi:hypothetical protein
MTAPWVEQAINDHQAWIDLLVDKIRNDELQSLNPARVAKSNLCKFGNMLPTRKGIDIDGQVYEAVMLQHATFHVESAQLVRLALYCPDRTYIEQRILHLRTVSESLAQLLLNCTRFI